MVPAEWRELMFGCERRLSAQAPRTAALVLREAADALDADERSDHYGDGAIVAGLEQDVATRLGKEAAVLMPSGTMAQLIALRLHCEARGSSSVAFHPTCHLELHEQGAYMHLHGLKAMLLGHRDDLITVGDVEALTAGLGAVLLELPQRELGGRLPVWEDLTAQVAAIRRHGAAVHLDGARLWQITPFYERTLPELCDLFDTVYVSLYKDLGGLAGAVLAGPAELIAQARVWRRRHGGTLPRLYWMAAAARRGLDELLPRMTEFRGHAVAVAAAMREVPGAWVVPDPPQTPMFHLHLRGEPDAVFDRACALARDRGVWLLGPPGPTAIPGLCRTEITIGDPALAITPDEAAELLDHIVNG